MVSIRAIKTLTKTEICTKPWGIAVTDLSIYFGEDNWELWTGIDVECPELNELFGILEDAAGRSTNRGGRACGVSGGSSHRDSVRTIGTLNSEPLK